MSRWEVNFIWSAASVIALYSQQAQQKTGMNQFERVASCRKMQMNWMQMSPLGKTHAWSLIKDQYHLLKAAGCCCPHFPENCGTLKLILLAKKAAKDVSARWMAKAASSIFNLRNAQLMTNVSYKIIVSPSLNPPCPVSLFTDPLYIVSSGETRFMLSIIIWRLKISCLHDSREKYRSGILAKYLSSRQQDWYS